MQWTWDILERWDVIFGIAGGVTLILSSTYWGLQKFHLDDVLGLLAWALIGKSDKNELLSFIKHALTWMIALFIWGFIGTLLSIFSMTFRELLLRNSIDINLNDFNQLIAISAITGMLFRSLWPLAKWAKRSAKVGNN